MFVIHLSIFPVNISVSRNIFVEKKTGGITFVPTLMHATHESLIIHSDIKEAIMSH
jgi:hypothetical protein